MSDPSSVASAASARLGDQAPCSAAFQSFLALEELHRLDTLLSALPRLDHRLEHFEPVEIVRLHPPPWIEIASVIVVPGGISSGGRRWARGTELLAIRPKPICLDVSYIAFAQSQR